MSLRSESIDSSLYNLLKVTQNLECADRRDRVYALLSVATTGHEGIEADYNLGPLYLAHCILRIKYATRQPGALDDVLLDCEFLEGVSRIDEGAMLRYRRHNARGHNDSEDRLRWSRWEWNWTGLRCLDLPSRPSLPYSAYEHFLHIDTTSPRATLS